MGRALVMERVRSDVEVLARAGLDVGAFLAEVDTSVRRAVPYAAMCVSVQDPATSMPTATFKFGRIASGDSHDRHWCDVEFAGTDPTSFRQLSAQGATTIGMHRQTGGDVLASVRMREFMVHHFGFTDELRTVARLDGRAWGAFAMMRAGVDDPFDDEEIAFVASLSRALAAGLRTGVLARFVARRGSAASVGPAVIIVQRDDRITQVNDAAAHWLAELSRCNNSDGPVHTLAALADGARRYARGDAAAPARARVRVPDGTWLVLNGSRLSGAGGDVVIIIEEARPPEIVPLVVAAFELTPRERDVAELVLQGVSSKDIAATLHISVHTVQDHLKSIFEKADVRSRRELIARVFFDQYLPRLGTDIAPSGWFEAGGAA